MIITIQTLDEITTALETEVMNLVEWASDLNEDRFFRSVDQKWSSAQQVEHLRKSSEPLAKYLGKPKFLFHWLIGRPNRPSRSYDEVVNKYLAKLGALAEIPTNRFRPESEQRISKKQVLDDYLAVSEKLIRVISKWQDRDLDRYILPHPLLGKLTVREMMFFTIYHTRHHFGSIKSLYSEGQQ